MSTKITTQYGHAVPPAPRHSVTLHMPTWTNVEKFSKDPLGTIASFYNAYPRMKPHRDIASLAEHVLKHLNAEQHVCFLFSSLQSARECVEYAVSPRRNDGVRKKPVEADRISIQAFRAKDVFYAVVFPLESRPVVGGFWATPGVGVSSRFAEANLLALDQLTQVDLPPVEQMRSSFDTEAHQAIRERIIYYLDRGALDPEGKLRPTADDVYFFPTGMASIYKPHVYLSSHREGTTVLFGMAFMNTITAFQEFGSGYRFFGLGTDEDIRDLEIFLEEEHTNGRNVQAIWAEFPANPLLVTPDIVRLCALADQYDIVLAVDDTIGSFANIDITSMSDMLVTSLTKSFNGYADAIAGSVVLNPASRKYTELKSLFKQFYVPELYSLDAETINQNSRDYLERTIKLNDNAVALTQFLQSCAKDPTSSVVNVYYPTLNASGAHYKQFMRRTTPDFTPGYGCLFSVEFDDVASTAVFYDTLNVHDGPHLGAPFTLAYPYTMCAYGSKLDWAAQYGLKPTQIRVSAGMEGTSVLVEEFRIAVEAASLKKRESMAAAGQT